MSRLQNASMSSYKALSDWCHLCSRFCLRKLITSNKIEEDMLHLHHHVVSTIKRPSLLTSWRSSLYWTNYFTDFVGNKVHNRPLLSLWHATSSLSMVLFLFSLGAITYNRLPGDFLFHVLMWLGFFCTRRKLSVQLPFLICFGQFFGRYLWFQKLRWPILISHRMQLYFSFKLLYCNQYFYYSWCTYVCGRIHKKLFFHLQISFFAPNGKLILLSQ